MSKDCFDGMFENIQKMRGVVETYKEETAGPKVIYDESTDLKDIDEAKRKELADSVAQWLKNPVVIHPLSKQDPDMIKKLADNLQEVIQISADTNSSPRFDMHTPKFPPHFNMKQSFWARVWKWFK